MARKHTKRNAAIVAAVIIAALALGAFLTGSARFSVIDGGTHAVTLESGLQGMIGGQGSFDLKEIYLNDASFCINRNVQLQVIHPRTGNNQVFSSVCIPECDGSTYDTITSIDGKTCQQWEREINCEAGFTQFCEPFCGNSACEAPETIDTCPADCPLPPPVCGDGTCGPGEGTTCPADCNPIFYCGNGICEPQYGETPLSCSRDCHMPDFCGDLLCQANETVSSCSIDCKPHYLPDNTTILWIAAIVVFIVLTAVAVWRLKK